MIIMSMKYYHRLAINSFAENYVLGVEDDDDDDDGVDGEDDEHHDDNAVDNDDERERDETTNSHDKAEKKTVTIAQSADEVVSHTTTNAMISRRR